MAIGKRISERLKELHWKRNDLLAKIPSLTPQALSNLIRRDSVRSEWDEKIAEALGVSVLWLVYGQNPYTQQSSTVLLPLRLAEPAVRPEPVERLVTTALLLNRDGQLIALGYLEALKLTHPAPKAKAVK